MAIGILVIGERQASKISEIGVLARAPTGYRHGAPTLGRLYH
jgi:hypothetical protein